MNIANRIKFVFKYHLGERMVPSIVGAMKKNTINAYWYRDVVNFGDLITPLLLRKYGYTPVHVYPHKASLVSTGSILEHLSESYSGVILGSGFIYEQSRMKFPDAKVLSVRGKLSRDRLCAQHKHVTLGDPGLLASSIVLQRQTKKYVLGIVPHHVQASSPIISSLAGKDAEKITVIDVQQQPKNVFKLIDECEYIISSSMHGLIVADSFGIPNAWMAADELIGGRFKFDDYYSSLNMSAGNPFHLTGGESLTDLVAMTSAKPVDRINELRTINQELWSNLVKML